MNNQENLFFQLVEEANEKEQKTNEDHCMLNGLSEEQLQEIQGGSEEEKMKVLNSPVELGGTSSWLKGQNRSVASHKSALAQFCISEAIKGIKSWDDEYAHNALNLATDHIGHAKRSAENAWESYRAEQMKRRR
jgi:hypothetical protein